MKLTIDRQTWLRGEGSQESALLRKKDNRMCCLGFLGLACGFTPEQMMDIQTPAHLNLGDREKWPEGTFNGYDNAPNVGDVSQVIYNLMNANDIREVEDREELLKNYFDELGIEVEFIN